MPFSSNRSGALQSNHLHSQPAPNVRSARRAYAGARLLQWGTGLALSVTLVGCSVLPKPQAAPSLFDFGVGSAPATATGNAGNSRQVLEQRPIFVAPVTARGLPSNTQVMLYRLNYAQDMQLRGYQQSRWSQPVEQLVGQQLRKQLAQQRPVFSDGLNVNFGRLTTSAAPAVLHVNLQRFEQVFSAPAASDAVFQAEVTLVEPGLQGDRLLGQRLFDYSVTAEPADAIGAAKAFAQASAQFTADVNAWVTQLIEHNASGHASPGANP